jgi:S-adenosylmethionine synthetase
VNTADDPNTGNIYLTVTGTSAESGDDGQAGRGNRDNGLITPYRPMTMESVAGKNPITHVGKLYNVAATSMAAALVGQVPEVSEARCMLVSQIGRPVTDPRLVEVRLRPVADVSVDELTARVGDIVHREIQNMSTLWRKMISGAVSLY